MRPEKQSTFSQGLLTLLFVVTLAAQARAEPDAATREKILAEFYPYRQALPQVAGLTPAMTINKDNAQLAAPVLPPEVLKVLQSGDLAMTVQATTDLPVREEYIQATLMMGAYLNQAYHGRLYAKAQNQRRALQAAYDEVLKQVDVLVMPTTPNKSHKYEPKRSIRELIEHGWNMLGNTAPFDMTGHPSLSVPCGKSNGLPVGLMLTGRHFEDGTLLRVGDAFERQMTWEKR